jgi:hypothetical protein
MTVIAPHISNPDTLMLASVLLMAALAFVAWLLAFDQPSNGGR